MTALGLALALTVGCASGRAFRSGQSAARKGDWDTAVAYFRQALSHDPRRIDIKISLQRAMTAASAEHLQRARELEGQDQIAGAAAEYRLAADLDPANNFAAAKAVSLERQLREQIDQMRPPSKMDVLRAEAQKPSGVPYLVDPRQPVNSEFTNTAVRDILTSIGVFTDINVTFAPTAETFLSRAYTIKLQDTPLEQALNQVLSANQLTFKVISQKGILVYPDDAQNRQRYDDVFVQVFYLSHTEPQEMTQLLTQLTQGTAVRPIFTQNKNSSALTVKATLPVLEVIASIIKANDKPRAEVMIDVEILEVDRQRVKELGIDLSNYALGFTFSPEFAPPNTSGTFPGAVPPPFNLNTVSQGISTADFYATVPTALIRLLETDSNTRLLARPQLRGTERQQLTLTLGDDIPVPQTTFAAQAAGGIATIPTTSFQYRSVGVNLTITPQVSFEGEILLNVTVESSRVGANVEVAGQSLPSFGTRRAATWLRLRDGESNLLAGLLREEDRRTVKGMPFINKIPFIRSLFGSTDARVEQSDIVMIITPRILRSQELTANDLRPMYVGTGANFGSSSTPPLIAPGTPMLTPSTPTSGAPGTSPTAPPATAGAPPPAAPPPPASRAVNVVPVSPAGATPATATPPPSGGPARITVTAPGAELPAGGGPYNVPLTIANATGVSNVTVSITYNPAVLRAREVIQGSAMREGGVTPTFVPRIDAATGRIDIALARPADAPAASGNNLLVTVVFETVAPGVSTITLSGVAISTSGQQIPLTLVPTTVTVK